MMESTKRPFPVTLPAILAGIATILAIGAAMGRPDAARRLIDDLAALRTGFGAFTAVWLAIALVNAVLAYGYWAMRDRARKLGVIVVSVALGLDLVALVIGPVAGLLVVTGLGVHFVLLAYLVTPSTRSMFEETA